MEEATFGSHDVSISSLDKTDDDDNTLLQTNENALFC